MQIAELEARDDAAWRAYCRIRDAANGSMAGSTALAEFQRVYALITDPDPKGFEQFAREVEAADKSGKPGPTAAAKPAAKEAAEEWADEEAEDDEDDARASSHKPKGK